MSGPRRDREYIYMDESTSIITRLRNHALSILESKVAPKWKRTLSKFCIDKSLIQCIIRLTPLGRASLAQKPYASLTHAAFLFPEKGASHAASDCVH
jgi:hypothetical protein